MKRGKKRDVDARDLAARIAATAINEVLKELSINQIVDGVAVFPSGSSTYYVDVVMLDLATNGTWTVSFTVPFTDQKQREETNHGNP